MKVRTTVVFVHGITVRRDRFSRLLTSLRYGLCLSHNDVEVKGCYWGDLAAIDEFHGIPLPSSAHGTRGVGDDPFADQGWWADPLGGLRKLRDAENLQPMHGLALVPEPVRNRNQALNATLPA